jgi:lipopolysaccharide export system ATP-binding protein
MLSAEQLVKSLAGRRIIEDVTLLLGRGEIVGLLGPNGAGKTTTFRMLAGMELPDAGSVRLDGEDVTHMEFFARARRGVTLLPQDTFVHKSLSVEDNIWMVLEAHEPSVEMRREKLESLLQEFHLVEVRRRRAGKLSGGQRRRCEIAIALACEPAYALLDEPFAGVDPQTVEEIGGMIRRLSQRNVGVLITDHNARELLNLVERAYVIESGRVLAHGSAHAVIADAEVRRVYLGETFRL